jgi:hypothetical protein
MIGIIYSMVSKYGAIWGAQKLAVNGEQLVTDLCKFFEEGRGFRAVSFKCLLF